MQRRRCDRQSERSRVGSGQRGRAERSGPASEAAAEPVTIEFYDLHINEPGKSLIAQVIQEFEAAHPNVTIKPTILENEALKAKIATEMQAGNPPDLFQSWGGGVLAQQVDAGMVRPIDDEIADWKDSMNAAAMSIYQVGGKQYGVPYNFGLVGLLVQQGPLRRGRHQRPAGDLG